MTSWNYRILAKKSKRLKSDEDFNTVEYALYEVYYDDNNKPVSHTERSMTPLSFDEWDNSPLHELKQTLQWMLEACEKPILDYDNFPNEYKNLKRERKKKLNKISKNAKK